MGRVLLTLLALCAPAPGEIIDRIAVSVGNRAITQSEIERHARLTAFLNGEQPDVSPEGRRRTAERLVDQKLVARELDAARYPAPREEEAAPMLAELRKGYGDEAAWRAALASAGITEEELRAHLLWQVRFLRFIDMRFRPGVQVTEEEVREYFEKTIRPLAAQANPGNAPSLDEYRDEIEAKLAGERVDQDLERWLQAARRRTPIAFREGAFE
jgi:peptidyl-prolyl cis-trans isomerase SurA